MQKMKSVKDKVVAVTGAASGIGAAVGRRFAAAGAKLGLLDLDAEATEDFDRYLDEQLGKLQTDHIDFYLFHGLRKPRWAVVKEQKLLGEAEKALADGRIRHLGFSFHDEFEVFKDIIDAYDGWSMCQVQYNYMDIENQAGTKGVQYAASKGLGVVNMEGLLGGRLVEGRSAPAHRPGRLPGQRPATDRSRRCATGAHRRALLVGSHGQEAPLRRAPRRIAVRGPESASAARPARRAA